MSVRDIIKSKPYFSDLDEKSNRMMVLFIPGRTIQTRELIEMQSILQEQVSRFAGHVFKNGSVVSGGETSMKTVSYIKLQPTNDGIPVDATQFLGKRIGPLNATNDILTTNGTVIAVALPTSTEPATLYVDLDAEYVESEFQPGRKIRVVDSGLTATMSTTEDYKGESIFVGINPGVFFIEGRFVHVDGQSVICDRYGLDVNGVVGLEYGFKVVTSDEDSSLNESARGSRNFGAPGADRLVAHATLKFIATPQESIPESFVNILTIENGRIKTNQRTPIYSEIGDELARRTFDESGSYTVRPFKATTFDDTGVKILSITHSGPALAHKATVLCAVEHRFKIGDSIRIDGATGGDASLYNVDSVVETVIDEFTFTYSLAGVPSNDATGISLSVSRPDHFTAQLSPGKAYVFGYARETIAPTNVRVRRARDTAVIQNFSTAAVYGAYVQGTMDVANFLDDSGLSQMNLLNASNVAIGTCRVRRFTHHSGSPTSGSSVWRAYIYDVRMNSGSNFALVRKISNPTTTGRMVLELDANDTPRVYNGKLNSLVFRVPNGFVKSLQPNGTSDTTYVRGVRFNGSTSGGSNSVSFTVSGTDYFVGPIGVNFAGTDTLLKNYVFFDTASNAQIYPTSAIIASGGQQITFQFGSSQTVGCMGSVTKTLATHKTKSVTTGSVSLTYLTAQSIYSLNVADVFEITSITANGVDVTHLYTLDDGQRDTHYDHAQIVQRVATLPGIPNSSPLVINFKRFSHTGTGFFCADSYAGVPNPRDHVYVVQATGERIPLVDAIDFRPVRSAGGSAHSGSHVPNPDSLITADLEFYLPRRDLLVLRKNGRFDVVEGSSSLTPRFPARPDDAMTIYELHVRPFTANATTDVDVGFVENKRYTMLDIGKIDRRVDRLERYTALSLLEMNTKAMDVVDSDGLDRFKNGFLVDAFTGHGVGDVYSADYTCAIDPAKRELRPSFTSKNVKLSYTAESSSALQVGNDEIGHFLTLPYTAKTFQEHLVATSAVSVNPYNVITQRGIMTCVPPSDDWIDTTVKPAVNVDLTGDLDAWNFGFRGFGTQWNDWETTWSGASVNVTENQEFDGIRDGTTTTTTTTTTTNQRRTGTTSVLGSSVQTASIGEKIVDVNLTYYMRQISVDFTCHGLRPNTNLHMFIDETKMNASVVPATGFAPTTEGCVRTDARGSVRGTITIPGGTFRTGERVLKLTSDPNDVTRPGVTWAKYVFASSGLIQTKQDSIISVRVPEVTTQAVSENRSLVNVQTSTSTVWNAPPNIPEEPPFDNDPIAQSFSVTPGANPFGVFLDSVDVFFKSKPESADSPPVWVEIRPLVNGYPDSIKVVPFSRVFKQQANVNVPANTDQLQSIVVTPTQFKFPVPVYLAPNTEYCLVVGASTGDYECYVSEVGSIILGTNNISIQTNFGSFFKSQNGTTWNASQTEDLMHRINVCQFDTNVVAQPVFGADHVENVRANLVKHLIETLTFDPVASITYEHKVKDKASGLISSTWAPFTSGVNFEFSSEKAIVADGDFQIRARMSTSRADVAPLIDLSRNSLVCVANDVNRFGLLAEDFEILNQGTGYTGEPTITVSGGGGAGCVVRPVMSLNRVVGVIVDDPGSNYTSEPTITVSGGGGSGASIAYRKFETGAFGGNAKARYLTRKVTLEGDWTTDFIRVVMDINTPSGTDVKVYVKELGADDPDPIDRRPWVEMIRESSAPVISGDAAKFTEVSWIPASGSLGYSSGGVSYDMIKTYAIKIVLLSDNTSVVPRCRDMRAITAAPS